MPLNAFAPDEWEDEDSLTRVRLPHSVDTVPRGDAANRRPYHSEPVVSEPTLRRARDWEAEAALEPVEEPEAETLVALPKRSPRLELDPRLLPQRPPPEPPPPPPAISSPVAAHAYGFVAQQHSSVAPSPSRGPITRASMTQAPVRRAPEDRGSQTEAPSRRSQRASATRKRVKLRNGLPFVAPSKPVQPAVPLVNGLPFVPTPSSNPLPVSSWAQQSSNEFPVSSWSSGAHPTPPRQAVLPSYPPVPSPLPLPARPSEIDWKESHDERRVAQAPRTDTGVTPDGLPPTRQRRQSWPDRIAAAIDLPLWAVALVGTSLVVVTLTVAFALLLDSQAPPRVLVASLPKPTVAADLADGTGTLRITSDQKGVSAEVDGVDRGPLPLTMEKMDAGEHELRLHGEGLVEQTRKVTIDAGRTLHIADVKLRVDGAAPAPPSDSADVAELREARDRALAELEEKRRERAEKLAEAKEQAAKKAADKKAEADKAAKLAEQKKKADEKKKAQAEKAAAGGMGIVNINSLPSSKAMVDGVVVGNTPVMGFSLPAGPHSVVFVHPKYGKASVGVNVQPGKTAVASHRFPYESD